MKYRIARPVNGISINGDEYVCDNSGKIIDFKTEKDAFQALYDAGYTDDDIEAACIIVRGVPTEFEKAKQENDIIYCDWLRRGGPEADTKLNDSNRKLIQAYLQFNPNAVGYKYYEGIVELKGNPLYNFCCDCIFDRSLADKVLKAGPMKIDSVLNTSNSCHLIWS